MAREASITPEQVAEVAEKIKNSGGKPTARAVREVLGGGSMATVLKYLQQWQGGQIRASEAEDTLDPAIAKAIASSISSRIQSATAESAARLADLQTELGAMIQENERQSQEIADLRERLDAQAAELAGALGRAAQTQSELSQVRAERDEQAKEAERLRAELAKASLRLESIPRLEEEIRELKNALETEKKIRTQAEQEAAVAAGKLDDLTRRIGEDKEWITTIEAENKSLESALETERKDRARIEQQAAVAAERTLALEEKIRDLIGREAVQRKEIEDLKSEAREIAKHRDELAHLLMNLNLKKEKRPNEEDV